MVNALPSRMAAGHPESFARLGLIQVVHITQPEGLELVEAQFHDLQVLERNPLGLVDAVGAVAAAESLFAWTGQGSLLFVHMHKNNIVNHAP
jgi:hypothetical protein